MKNFTIPTVIDIVEFIASRNLGWPQSFIEYYAERFWNHYTAQGWVLSNGVRMKNWQAAFNSNWRELKYEDDRKKLAEMKVRQMDTRPITNSTDQTPAYIDTLLDDFKDGKPDRQLMAGVYKWLWSNGYMQFTAKEVEGLVRDAGNERWYGRFLSVRLFFKKLIEQNITFHDFISSRNQTG